MSTAAASFRIYMTKTIKWSIVGATAASAYHQYQWFAFRSCSAYDAPLGGPTDNDWLDDDGMNRADGGRSMSGKKKNTLEALDHLGGYPATAYNMNGVAENHILHPPLSSHSLNNAHQSYDVCVVGGGFAGLHAAISLAERGKKVVILESKRIGHAASGRNGGDALVGFHTEFHELAALVGDDKAKALYSQTLMGYRRLKHLIKKHKIQCGAKEEGAITMMFSKRFDDLKKTESGGGAIQAEEDKNSSPKLEAEVEEARQHCAEMNARFGEEQFVMTKKDIETKLGKLSTDRYAYGIFNPKNLTLNPLELSLGLARAAIETGRVRIHEHSPVVKMLRIDSNTVACNSRWLVMTETGSVRADEVVLATNGAPAHLTTRLALATTPISTGIVLTEPLPKDLLDDHFTAKCAVFDERFALAYFRRVPGNRILYGALASGLPMNPQKMEKKLIDDLTATFPSLAPYLDACVSWQGMLESRWPIFPVVGRDNHHDGLWYSLGFAGHGLVPTCAAGEVLASAICSIDHLHDKKRRALDLRHELWSEVGYLTGAKHTPMPEGSIVANTTCTSLPPLSASEIASAKKGVLHGGDATEESDASTNNKLQTLRRRFLARSTQLLGPQHWVWCPVFPIAGGPLGYLGCSAYCGALTYVDKWANRW